jgi:hypothetical protein
MDGWIDKRDSMQYYFGKMCGKVCYNWFIKKKYVCACIFADSGQEYLIG